MGCQLEEVIIDEPIILRLGRRGRPQQPAFMAGHPRHPRRRDKQAHTLQPEHRLVGGSEQSANRFPIGQKRRKASRSERASPRAVEGSPHRADSPLRRQITLFDVHPIMRVYDTHLPLLPMTRS
jgi:hypothetical protein